MSLKTLGWHEHRCDLIEYSSQTILQFTVGIHMSLHIRLLVRWFAFIARVENQGLLCPAQLLYHELYSQTHKINALLIPA